MTDSRSRTVAAEPIAGNEQRAEPLDPMALDLERFFDSLERIADGLEGIADAINRASDRYWLEAQARAER